MTMKLTFAAALLAATVMGGAANAKTLVYCAEAAPEGFDPAPYTAGQTFDASSRTVFNRLVEFDHGKTTISPGLAESWTISDDGKEYTFKLRKGVKFAATDYFTPTRDFNADDVVFSFERQVDKSGPWFEYIPGIAYQYYNDQFGDNITKVEKVDDYTVKFTLKEPNITFIPTLGMDFASVVSKEYADKLQADKTPELFNQKPVGTGPYIFVDYQTDAAIRYKANPDYWGGKQKIDDLIFAITTDPAVRAQKLKAGECNIMSYPAPADISGLQADPNLKVDEQEGLNIGALMYNTQQKPFDDVRVRKALNMAINKQAIIDAVFQGAGTVAINPIPPTMWGYNKDIKDDPYDPDAAKKLLEEAGVKDLKMNVWAMPVQRPYMPNARRAAELIQADFAKVGVTAEIVTYDWGEYLKRSLDKDRDGAVMLGWTGGIADPDNFLAALLSCKAIGSANRANWCNEDFEKLIQAAKLTTDQAERTKLYEQAQVVFKEQAPWLTIAHQIVEQPISKKVKDFRIDPFGGYLFEDVDIDE